MRAELLVTILLTILFVALLFLGLTVTFVCELGVMWVLNESCSKVADAARAVAGRQRSRGGLQRSAPEVTSSTARAAGGDARAAAGGA